MNAAQAYEALMAGKMIEDYNGYFFKLIRGSVRRLEKNGQEIPAWNHQFFNGEFRIVETEREAELRHLRVLSKLTYPIMHLDTSVWVHDRIAQLENNE